LTATRDNVASGGSPNNSNSSRSTSENISFRLRKDQLDQLRKEANEKRITLNTLANQIVDFYVNYTANASKADLIPFAKQEIISLLDGYEEEEIKAKVRQIIRKFGKDIALQLRGKYDFEAGLGVVDSWILASGFPHRRNKDTENNRHTFIVQHNMGRKYSVYAAEGFKTYVEPLVTNAVEYSITDNSMTITVEGEAYFFVFA
jgi:hypothetical protein